MTTTGIAGAMDYVPHRYERVKACRTCGEGFRRAYAAGFELGKGAIQFCTKDCLTHWNNKEFSNVQVYLR